MKKVVLITGCSSPAGIGFNTVHQLAREGHIVYATVRNKSKSHELRKSIDAVEGIHIKYLDLLNDEMIVSVVRETIEEQGRIDVLVNNAGYGLIGLVEGVSIEQAKREYDVNVFAAVRLIQEVLPHMRKEKSGHIINISSIFCAGMNIAYGGFYLGTKAALEKISEALAFEVAQFNIKVTNFQPGPVRTKLSIVYGDRRVKGEVYQGTFESQKEYLLENVGYEMPRETAKAIGEIVRSNNPALYEHSVDHTVRYVSRFKKDITGMSEFRNISNIAPLIPKNLLAPKC